MGIPHHLYVHPIKLFQNHDSEYVNGKEKIKSHDRILLDTPTASILTNIFSNFELILTTSS